MGWKERGSPVGDGLEGEGISWRSSRTELEGLTEEQLPPPAPLLCSTSQPGQKTLLEHPSRSKTCTILFTPTFIPFTFIFSHILPHVCGQLKPHNFPASPWGSPSNPGEAEAPSTPDPRGCPRLSPHRKPQPWCGTSTPKTCPGRAGPLSWALGTLQTPGHCSQHFPRQHISLPGIPRWRSSSASPQGQHRGHPLFLHTDRRRDVLGHREVTLMSLTCHSRAQAGKADPAGSWHRGSPLPPPWNHRPLGWEGHSDILPISSLSTSLSAGAPRENPRDHNPQFPPSQPRETASGTFPGWLGETVLLSPPWWLQQQLQGWECPIPPRNNFCSTPRAGTHSSAPGFILAGTKGTSAGFAAPWRKQGFGKGCSQPLLAPVKHHQILPWHLGGGSSFSPLLTACSCRNSRISSCHSTGLSCWKGPVSISHFIYDFPSSCATPAPVCSSSCCLHSLGSSSIPQGVPPSSPSQFSG